LPIRIKLLLLLLAIALPPLVVVTWLDQGAARRLGMELTDRARATLEERAAESLDTAVRSTANILRVERGLLEVAVQLQAREVERLLASPAPQPVAGRVVPAGATALAQGAPSARHGGRTISASALTLATSLKHSPSRATVGRLSALLPFLLRLHGEHAGTAAWHRVALVAEGVEAVYPAVAGQPFEPLGEVSALPWVEAARLKGGWGWMGMIGDPLTGVEMFRVAAPVRRPGGGFAGAAALDVPVSWVLSAAERQVPTAGHAVIVMAGGQGLRVVAERLAGGMVGQGNPLAEGTPEGLRAIAADIAKGGSGTRRMDFHGTDSLWAWSGLGDGVSGLLVVMPHAVAVSEAGRGEAYVADRVDRQRLLAWAFLLVFVPMVVVLALVASRHVTRPVHELAEAARLLSEGDFEAHTRIRSGDELEALGKVFNRMVPQLRERMRMRESLGLAQEVQRNLLPSAAPQVPGFDVAGTSIYCDETGGDYYDFYIPHGDGPLRLAVAVGDVAGHGVAAALLMTAARALLRSRAVESGRLAELMEGLNRDLSDHVHAGRFMTLFLAVLEPGARSIHWVSAGHDPALAYDPESDRFEEVTGVDIPLGIDPEWRFQERQHSGWHTGAVLVVGTDGIWESRDPDGEMYGKERLRQVVRAASGLTAQGIVDAVTADLKAFRRLRSQVDDATLVVVKAV
jgi:phosphoserine phosphatase RsbU/P